MTTFKSSCRKEKLKVFYSCLMFFFMDCLRVCSCHIGRFKGSVGTNHIVSGGEELAQIQTKIETIEN